jgi:predicted RNA-binding Zn ribbon-like protein
MRLSEKYPVPAEVALLYDFANSLDLRRFVEQGAAHAGGDELATARQLKDWMQARGLLRKGERIDGVDHHRALALREAVRSFLKIATEDGQGSAAALRRFNEASADFPLVLGVSSAGAVTLQPAPRASGLARILAELQLLADTDRLGRLKMCASDDCRWIFFDRSKPGNRRWCSSALCGNRQKTRAYRERQRQSPPNADMTK